MQFLNSQSRRRCKVKLVTNPDILHQPCEEIKDQKLLNQRVVKLITTMKFLPNAKGLADNQIGGKHRIFAIRLEGKKTVSIFVNPVFSNGMTPPEPIKTDEGYELAQWQPEGTFTEECLSIKGRAYDVNRFYEINAVSETNGLTCQYFANETHFTGIDAQCIQHEIDHLNGRLISDGGAK